MRACGGGVSVDKHARVRLAVGLACACAIPRGAGGGGYAQACAPSVGASVCPGACACPRACACPCVSACACACACVLYTERSLLLCLKIVLMKRKIIRLRGPLQIKDLC